MRKRKRMNHRLRPLLCFPAIIGCFVWGESAHAMFDFTQDYNYVTFADGRLRDGGGLASNTGQVFDGPAELFDSEDASTTIPNISWAPGYVEAYGKASSTELKARVKIEGRSITRQLATAETYDVFTIAHDTLPTGTAGSLTMRYVWDGSGSISTSGPINTPNLLGDVISGASLSVILHPALNELPMSSLAFDFVEMTDGDILVQKNQLTTATVTFQYGIAFGLRSILSVVAENDFVCNFNVNSGLFCGGGNIDAIDINYAQTAKLASIGLPDGASISGLSLSNYSALVGAPVPIPAGIWLLVSGLAGLLVKRNSKTLRR